MVAIKMGEQSMVSNRQDPQKQNWLSEFFLSMHERG